jgi:periplasmic mercuric ion binding protein
VQVDLDRKIATVVYETDKASPAALTEATTAAGFPSSARE